MATITQSGVDTIVREINAGTRKLEQNVNNGLGNFASAVHEVWGSGTAEDFKDDLAEVIEHLETFYDQTINSYHNALKDNVDNHNSNWQGKKHKGNPVSLGAFNKVSLNPKSKLAAITAKNAQGSTGIIEGKSVKPLYAKLATPFNDAIATLSKVPSKIETAKGFGKSESAACSKKMNEIITEFKKGYKKMCESAQKYLGTTDANAENLLKTNKSNMGF